MPSLVEITQLALQKKNFNFSQIIFAFSLSSTLGKVYGTICEQTLIPFTQECFVQSLVEIGLAVLEKKMTTRKVNRGTDNEQQATKKDLLVLSAQMSYKSHIFPVDRYMVQ